MLKRLFSKRSGFTLVEIIVAVAIFAIMSTIVAQVLQLSVKARQSNNEYGAELARQEEQLLKVTKDKADYQTANKTGDYEMAFKATAADGTTTDVADVKLPYAIKDSGRSDTAEGINYFVSPVPYDGKFSGGGTGGGGAGGEGGDVGSSSGKNMSMASLVDVRLTGSRGMSYVNIEKVEKVASPTEGAAVRYIFTTSASSEDMKEQEKAFANYKLYFYLTDKLDPVKSAQVNIGKKSDGTEFKYTKDIPMPANIISADYVGDRASGSPVVRCSGGNCVTVSVALGYEGGKLTGDNYSGKGFVGEKTTFYVDFEEDPGITAASFGSNGTPSGSGYEYTKYSTPVDGGGAYENQYIYGAYGTKTDPTKYGGFIWRDLNGNIITSL